jgi:hypothetical protein
MLGELLPISDAVMSQATLRRHALAVDARLDQRVTAVALDEGDPDMAALVRQRLPNVRHQMWNGQWHRAIARMKTIYQGTCDAATRLGHAAGEHMQRFRKHLRDLRDYIVNNQTSLTNYAHAYRNGLRISSAPAESGMSHVVNQRMGKRQQRPALTPPAVCCVLKSPPCSP